MDLSLVQKVVAWGFPALFAITVHEVAHGWVAKQLGDPTAMMLGRLTLNPVKHIDPIGTIIVPIAVLMMTKFGFVFGWARPVPVTWQNLRRPKRDMALVALAGPGANLAMALMWALVLRLAVSYHDAAPWVTEPMVFMSIAGMFVNTILMVLNLVPLPPLDGGRVLTGILPPSLARPFSRVEPYGFMILIALLISGLLATVIWPVIEVLVVFLSAVAGISAEGFAQLLSGLS